MIIRYQPTTTTTASDYWYVDTYRRGRLDRIKGRSVADAATAALSRINTRRWRVGLTAAMLGPQQPAWGDNEAARFDVIASNTEA
jgi:hypothetical protein